MSGVWPMSVAQQNLDRVASLVKAGEMAAATLASGVERDDLAELLQALSTRLDTYRRGRSATGLAVNPLKSDVCFLDKLAT